MIYVTENPEIMSLNLKKSPSATFSLITIQMTPRVIVMKAKFINKFILIKVSVWMDHHF